MTCTPQVLILVGSARLNGNTWTTGERLRRAIADEGDSAAVELLDLGTLDIGSFDYQCSNAADDLMSVVDRMLAADVIVFTTPVYWYTMATIMKNFFDRLTDLVLVPANRPTGRALAGRSTFLLSNGEYPELPPGFEEPFRLSSEYLAMEYREGIYVRFDGDVLTDSEVARIDAFAGTIVAAPGGVAQAAAAARAVRG